MFNNIDKIFNTPDESLRRIALLEDQFRQFSTSGQRYFVQGRLRTDRAIPTNSADVIIGADLLYDRVLTATAEYILINNAGTLAWREITLNVF